MDRTFLEFFAGAGLVRAGLEPHQWRCLFANDIDPRKERIYKQRFSGSEMHLGCIRDTQRITAMINGNATLASASFPCVDLSIAGKRMGFRGHQSSTIFSFLDILDALPQDRKPKIIMLENVMGFLTSDRGRDFTEATSRASASGYWMSCMVIDAKWFVPQSRPRVFVIGVSESLRRHSLVSPGIRQSSLLPKALAEHLGSVRLSTGWVSFNTPDPVQEVYDIRDYLDLTLPWWEAERAAAHMWRLQPMHREVLDRLSTTGSAEWIGLGALRTRGGFPQLELRFDGLANCLRVYKGGGSNQIVVQGCRGEVKMRYLHGSEYARLQGVVDTGNTDAAMKFAYGDAVCVPVIDWIAANVLNALTS